MSEFKDCPQLLKQYKLRPFELLNYIENGLQPYTQNGVKFPCPKEYNQAHIRSAEQRDNAEEELKSINQTLRRTVDIRQYLDEVEKHLEDHNDHSYKTPMFKKNSEKCYMISESVWIFSDLEKAMAKVFKNFDFVNKDSLKPKVEKYFEFTKPSKNIGPNRTRVNYNNIKSKIYLTEIQVLKFLHDNYHVQKLRVKEKLETIYNTIETTEWNFWGSFEIPQNDTLVNSLLNVLKNKIFRNSDIEKIRKEPSKQNKERSHVSNPVHLKDTEPVKTAEQLLDDFLNENLPEVERFYNSMEERYRYDKDYGYDLNLDKNFTEAPDNILHDYAIKIYEDKKNNFNLQKMHIHDLDIYTLVQNRKKSICGKILKHALIDAPEGLLRTLYKSKDIAINANALYERAKNLKATKNQTCEQTKN